MFFANIIFVALTLNPTSLIYQMHLPYMIAKENYIFKDDLKIWMAKKGNMTICSIET